MRKELKIKVCGMRDPENIQEIAVFRPDYIGYIFYQKSKRFVGENPDKAIFSQLDPSIKKVGVFVDEEKEKLIGICKTSKLDIVQLHGAESPEYCSYVRQNNLNVFKAFSVDSRFDFSNLKAYKDVVDYFLFDTKGQLPGGTGQKFNWEILSKYQLNVPFFLSGGIRLEDLGAIRNFMHPALFGIDINSGFEIEPALKNVEKVKDFIEGIREGDSV